MFCRDLLCSSPLLQVIVILAMCVGKPVRIERLCMVLWWCQAESAALSRKFVNRAAASELRFQRRSSTVYFDFSE